MPQGFVYILTNQAMPGIVKVGKTTANPTSRASQLSSATGVPERFSIYRQYAVLNSDAAEEFSHRILERVFGRPNYKREFFSGAPQDIANLLDEALKPYLASNDPSETNIDFISPTLRLENKEFTFAKLEFESLFFTLPLTAEKIAASPPLQRVAGAYLASCYALSEAPAYRCILDPRVKSRVMEASFAFAKAFESDPIGTLIEFVREIE